MTSRGELTQAAPHPTLDEYFAALRAGDLERAAQSFSDDIFYSHAAYDPGAAGPTGRRLEARGRDELLQVWRLRGDRDWEHHLTATVVGDRFYLEGEVTSKGSGARVFTFLSTGRFAEDGRIAHYVEYDDHPGVGSAGFRS